MSQPLYGTAQYGVDRYDFLFDRQAIVTINHTLVGSSTHTDFPVLVTGTYDFLKSASNGGDVQHSSGYDICFSATDGSVLAHEIEKYDPATGEIVVWVKVPTLSHTVDTVIHLLYGCPEVSTSLENPTGVWDAHFKGVYHLKDGATLSAADSTSNAFNGTITGATAVTGKVGGGADFDGNDKITLGSPHQYSDITVSGWVYPTANNNIETFWSNWTATNGLFIFRYGAVGGTVWLYWPNAAGTDQYITSTSVAALNTWTHVAFSFDASGNAKLYFNGVQEASTTSNRKNTTATAAQLGANPSGGDFYCKSILDEFRVSNSIRSADWLLAEYNNVSNASFVTVRQAGRYISGRARILRQETQSITGTARVKHERTQSIAGVVRVLRNEAQTITGVSRVLRNESQSITGAARVKHERTENITGTARISQARTESITGVSFLKYERTSGQTGKARIIGKDILPRVEIDGEPVSAIFGSLTITKELQGRTSTASFVLSGGTVPDLHSTVEIYNVFDGTKLFAGYVTVTSAERLSVDMSRVAVTCAGYEALLSKITINESYSVKTDREIIQDAFTALPEIGVTNATVDELSAALTLEFKDVTLLELLEQLSQISGAEYRITEDKELSWRAAGSVPAPIGFDNDSPDYTNTFEFRLGNHQKATYEFANRVTVLGGFVGSDELRAVAEDTDSQAELGRIVEAVVVNREIDNQTALDLAASIELQRRQPTESITIEWDHGTAKSPFAILQPGMMISLESSASGISGEYVIQQLALRQRSPKEIVFAAQVGDYRGDIATRLRQLDRIKNGPKFPVPVPPPPNSIGTDQLKNDAVTQLKLADEAVGTAQLALAAVTADILAASAVTTTKIADNAISTPKLVAGSVTSTVLASGSVIAGKVAAAAIVGSNIQAGSITAANAVFANAAIVNADIANATITGAKIGSATITGANIASATITGSNIASATITGSNIQGGTITGTQIASVTITGANIASSTISGTNIASATISGGNIASATITGSNIASATITAANIQNSTITGTQIAASTITGGNIASATITGANIQNSTITSTQIANATITGANIANSTITNTQIASATITGANIASATITAANIANATITSAQISSISASQITTGTLTVGGSVTVSGSINAASVTITNLNASNITTGSINGVTIPVFNLNGGTSLIDNSVTNSKIASLQADKVTAGQFVGSSLTLTSLNQTTTINNVIGGVMYAGFSCKSTLDQRACYIGTGLMNCHDSAGVARILLFGGGGFGSNATISLCDSSGLTRTQLYSDGGASFNGTVTANGYAAAGRVGITTNILVSGLWWKFQNGLLWYIGP